MVSPTPDFVEAGPVTRSYARCNLAGVAAVALGLASLGLAVLPPRLVDPPPQSLGQELRNLVRGVVTGQVAPELEAYDQTLKAFRVSAIATALLGVALLVVARVRREDRPLLWAAAAVVTLAMLWEWIVVGVVVAVVLVILVGLSH